jgi:polyphosphate kinase 2
MGKKKAKQTAGGPARKGLNADQHDASRADASAVVALGDTSTPTASMSRKEFETELERIQIELVKLQEWVTHTGAKICVLFEGRDTAGKGGVIKRLIERVSPRVFRVVALPAPTEREKSQMYIQRYIPHLPAAGEVVLFDRSWYNRAGVERVMGFATEEQVAGFLRAVPLVERAVIQSGVILVKYWLEVSQAEQTRRFRERMDDPRKTWKLTPMDLETHKRYYDYSRARDAMFAVTDTPEAPWFVVPSDDQRRARLNCIAHFLSLVPYEAVKRPAVTLPRAQPVGTYTASDHPFRYVPQRF